MEFCVRQGWSEYISLKERDREYLLADLEEAIGGRWLERIWEMIWKRWCSYEDFCHQK